MYQLQRIDALLELDVFIRELGLVFYLTQLLLDHLLRARSKGAEARTVKRGSNVSMAYLGRCRIPHDRSFRIISSHLRFFPNAWNLSMMAIIS